MRCPHRPALLVVLLYAPCARVQSHVSWAPVQTSDVPSGGRASMAFTPQSLASTSGGALNDGLWMFGGISSAAPLAYSNELWSFSASTGAWQLQRAASGPRALVSSAMCSIGHTLYLYGGASFDEQAHSDFYSYDTARGRWR